MRRASLIKASCHTTSDTRPTIVPMRAPALALALTRHADFGAGTIQVSGKCGLGSRQPGNRLAA